MDNKDLEDKLDELSKTLTEFRIEMAGEIATLKTKSGAWGGIAAIVVVVIAYTVKYLGGH